MKNDRHESETQNLDDTMEGLESELNDSKIDQNLKSFINNPLKTAKVSGNKIPAIKFTIAFDQCDKYKNQSTLSKEILRCHQTIDKKQIKFVSLKANLVIIATDVQDTYNLLNKKWPSDAFIKGIRHLKKSENQPKGKSLIIKNVHPDIDPNEEEIKAQLVEQGLINVTRIINNRTKTPTSLLKAETTNESSYQAALSNKIKIGFVKCPTEPLKTVTQCFKCQKTGHAHYNCQNSSVCPKCSGAHSLKQCQQENGIKCSNCGGDHFACSRRCPYLKKASADKIKQLQNQKPTPATNSNDITNKTRTYAQITKGDSQFIVGTNPNSNCTLETNIDSLFQNKILTIMEAKIEQHIERIIEKLILEKLPALIESALAKFGSNTFNYSSITKQSKTQIPTDTTPTKLIQINTPNPPTPKYIPSKEHDRKQTRSAQINE